MYRWLLCFRYLRTRYIALASVISVTLGVATLIVVNSVMAGFSAQMHERLHGLTSDILIESHTNAGLPDPERRLEEIMKVCGDQVVGSSASVHVPAMLGIEFNGQLITRHVSFVGLDPDSFDEVSHFGRYLLHPQNRTRVSFELRDGGYAPDREHFPESGWEHRRSRVANERAFAAELTRHDEQGSQQDRLAGGADESAAGPSLQFAQPLMPGIDGNQTTAFDPAAEQYPGIILGISTCSTPDRNTENHVVDHFYCRPGDDVRMMFPNASENAKVVNQKFTVVDLYESGMSEYDGTFVFCQLDQMQDFRGMVDPQTGARSVTTIQLRLADGADLYAVRDALRRQFPANVTGCSIQTWREMRGPMLSAVRMQTTLLNVLLFLIIAVAGFGILATFFMIVVEKTKDIGTLKAMGASSRGVMSIFLSYGLLLGTVGSAAGLAGGLLIVRYINQFAAGLEWATGREIFDPTIYYFAEIPTLVRPATLLWVLAGAVAIAAMASILPALRAARMHPVRALRFD